MATGLIVLLVVLAAATAAGFAMRSRQGRFQPAQAGAGTVVTQGESGTADTLSEADLGAPLGAQATLVQFSTEVCAYCGPARRLLSGAAAQHEGVEFLEIDAAQRMDLTRRLHVMATPTVLVLDAAGGILSRSSGPQRKADIEAALGQALSAAAAGRAEP